MEIKAITYPPIAKLTKYLTLQNLLVLCIASVMIYNVDIKVKSSNIDVILEVLASKITSAGDESVNVNNCKRDPGYTFVSGSTSVPSCDEFSWWESDDCWT